MAVKTARKSVSRVRPDSKGRVALGKLAEGVSSYRVTVDSNGKITLKPFIEIPAGERWLYENPEALKRVQRGLSDSEAGRTVSLGSFSHPLK